jgi:hypothetical protein
VFDVNEIRRDFDKNYANGSFMIISTPTAGETYVAGIDASTGTFKIIRAPIIEMLDALAQNPQDAGSRFESYQFVLRNYPKCVRCKRA